MRSTATSLTISVRVTHFSPVFSQPSSPVKFSVTLPIDVWDPSRGGTELYLDRLCRDLTQRGHEITVLCLSSRVSRPDVDSRGSRFRIQHVRIPMWPRWRREIAFARFAWREHANSGRDVLFAVRHALKADLYQPHGGSYRVARRERLKSYGCVARTLHTLSSLARPTFWALRWLDRAVFVHSPDVLVIAVSDKIEREFRQTYPTIDFRCVQLRNAVDLERFHDQDRDLASQRLKEQLNVGSGEHVAVFVAHQFLLKGLRHAIESIARSAAWHLVVAGRGRPASFRRLAKKLGAERRVHFIGPARDSRTLLAAADACLLPTYYDTCSLVILESLACGTPVVTTEQSGLSELLAKSEGGITIPSPDAIADTVSALATIASDWSRYHAAALRVRSQIGWTELVDEFERILTRAALERRQMSTKPSGR